LFLGLVAAAVGAVWYLRRKDDGSKKSSKSGSPFKFPEGKRASTPARRPNSKKSKAKARKAEKKKQQKNQQQKNQRPSTGKKASTANGSKGGDGQGQASTSVINYTYFDSARRDTVIPIHKKKNLTAKDIMDKDADAKT
jgi:hypothetical protein